MFSRNGSRRCRAASTALQAGYAPPGSNAQPSGAPKRGWCGGAQQFGLLRMPDTSESGGIGLRKNEGQDKWLVNGSHEPRFGGLPVLGAVLVTKVRLLRIELSVRLRGHLRAGRYVGVPSRLRPFTRRTRQRRARVSRHCELGEQDSKQRYPGNDRAAKGSHRSRIVTIGAGNGCSMLARRAGLFVFPVKALLSTNLADPTPMSNGSYIAPAPASAMRRHSSAQRLHAWAHSWQCGC